MSFGSLMLYEHFTIGIINEGEDLRSAQNQSIVKACSNYYKNGNFGYISHRLYSYSIDPTVYIENSKLDNLVAIAVVISGPTQKLCANIEKMFFKKPFEYFNSLQEAQKWIRNMVVLRNQQQKHR
jgi:hypothetical protein